VPLEVKKSAWKKPARRSTAQRDSHCKENRELKFAILQSATKLLDVLDGQLGAKVLT